MGVDVVGLLAYEALAERRVAIWITAPTDNKPLQISRAAPLPSMPQTNVRKDALDVPKLQMHHPLHTNLRYVVVVKYHIRHNRRHKQQCSR